LTSFFLSFFQLRTVSQFVKELLLHKKYYSTTLPPIPIPIMKKIEETIKEYEKEEER